LGVDKGSDSTVELPTFGEPTVPTSRRRVLRFTKRCTKEFFYGKPHFMSMRLGRLLESRLAILLLILGLSALMLLLDFFNPLTNFFKSWNLHYLINNLWEYLAVLVPAYFILGFLVGYDESMRLFIWFLWIPVLYYVLKGILFLCFIIQDPGLPHVIGAWFGGAILDWRDFLLIYAASSYIYIWAFGAICILFMALGLIVNNSVWGGVRGSAINARSEFET
jgi:hypothetical protein